MRRIARWKGAQQVLLQTFQEAFGIATRQPDQHVSLVYLLRWNCLTSSMSSAGEPVSVPISVVPYGCPRTRTR